MNFSRTMAILAIPSIIILQVILPLAMDLLTSLAVAGIGFWIGLNWNKDQSK